MWSLLHVVSDVRLEHSLEVPATEDQDVVEALSAHGPHEPEGCNYSVHAYEQRVWLWREGSMAPGFRPSLPLVAFE
jgi:hypothetical protein